MKPSHHLSLLNFNLQLLLNSENTNFCSWRYSCFQQIHKYDWPWMTNVPKLRLLFSEPSLELTGSLKGKFFQHMLVLRYKDLWKHNFWCLLKKRLWSSADFDLVAKETKSQLNEDLNDPRASRGSLFFSYFAD